MSKRKLPAAPEAPEAGRAAGKQRLQLPEEEDVNDVLLHEMLGDICGPEQVYFIFACRTS